MVNPAEDPLLPPSPDAAGPGAAIRARQEEARDRCQGAPEQIAERYGLSEAEARECVSAFDDLLHLDRHKSGLDRLAAIGTKAGKFLLDQLESCTAQHPEGRAHFITEALCRCLTPQVEAELSRLLKERLLGVEVRQFAIVALAHGDEAASKDLLVDLFCDYMQRDRDQREPLMFRALVLAMDSVKSPRAVPGLTRVIAEERRSSSVDLVMAAIGALGEIGDARAVEPLRKLVKNRQRWQLAPQACLALARLKDPKAGGLARDARQKHYTWTAWQLELFDEVERLCPEEPKKKGKAKDENSQKKEGSDA
jgi:hypothetical protein